MNDKIEQECEHEEIEYLVEIWSDDQYTCWKCVCLICGREIEELMTHSDEYKNNG